jgi:photosystem II stability/assembly factor-like uncharacterized protein
MINLFGKFLFLFLMILVQSASFAQGTWEKINVPTNQYLRSVFFTDSLYGWVAGDSGTILHTTDGGTSWNIQDTHGFNEVTDVFFLNRNLGWASSLNYSIEPFGTIMLKTTNGGSDWIPNHYPTENIFISCILFLDSLNGWMGGRPHAIVNTVNGGVDWVEAEVDTSTLAFLPVLSIQFYNKNYGYASGGMFDIAGVIWRTSNGGKKWYASESSEAPADEVHGLYIFDSLHVIGAGGDPDFGYGVGMSRTSDGGLHWNYEELDIQGNAYDIDFRNKTEAWAPLGPKQKLIYSLDAGTTWKWVSTPDSSAIYDIHFPDSLHGFAVGKKGAVLKYKPRIIPSVAPLSDLNHKFGLCQNYPNPVTLLTKIKYSVPSYDSYNHLTYNEYASFLELRFFDLLGNQCASLTDIDLSPGQHELEFKAGKLTPGIYFYQLNLISAGAAFPVAEPRKLIIQR